MADPALTNALFKADAATVSVTGLKDGKLRLGYTGWEDAKVILAGEELVVRCEHGQAVAYRRAIAVDQPAPELAASMQLLVPPADDDED